MTTANAVRISGYGSPDVLVYGATELRPLLPDEVRIKTIASAVNFTDLEIRAGHWPIRKVHPFPYVPGVEVVGEIVDVGTDVVGVAPDDRIITMMQGLGGVRGERPGGYAEYVTVAADALALISLALDPLVLAALGLGGVTAYEGLRRIGDLANKKILVTGAAGGVGSSAVAIARAQGATVVGVVTRSEQSDYVIGLGADEVVVAAHGELVPIETASVDGILDTVGAPLFAASMKALKPGGIFSLVGAVGGSDARFDLWDLIRPVTLTGYSSENLDGPGLGRAVAAITGWVETGAVPAPRFTAVPLAEAARAHAMLESRGVSGRLLLCP